MKQPSFFTNTDMTVLANCAGKRYNSKDSTDRENAEIIRSKLWPQTKYWAKEVCKVLNFREPKGRAAWETLAGRNGENRFKHYTWQRIYPERSHIDVFFTVGVNCQNGQAGLLIKIDFQRYTPKKLNGYQYIYLNEKILKGGEQVWRLCIENINGYNWPILIKKTTDFIKSHLKTYNTLLNEIDKYPYDIRYARLCWNNKGWKQPSGPIGKSTSKELTHEAKYGYGHEEWLFSEHFVDSEGWHYARLQPIERTNKNIQPILDLRLYTCNQTEKQYYWVADIKKAELVSKEQSIKVARQFFKQIKTIVSELSQIPGANALSLERWPLNDLFNIRYRQENLNHFGKEIIPFSSDQKISSGRYVLLNAYSALKQEGNTVKIDIPFPEVNETPFVGGSDPKEITRKSSPKTVVTSGLWTQPDKHEPLKNDFALWLKRQYPDYMVKVESKTHAGRADIVRSSIDGKQHWLYEVKTYSSSFECLKAAIAQLIFYAYSVKNPSKVSVEKFHVVSYLSPDENTKKMVDYLNRILPCPIEYLAFDLEKKTLLG